MDAISKYISYEKGTYSNTAIMRGIINRPGARELRAMKAVGDKIHTPITEQLFEGTPVSFDSFYRSPVLNKIVGGSKTSQHMKGEAIDLKSKKAEITNKQLFYWILENLEFDQLIWEFGDKNQPAWVHVSYVNPEIRANRKQVLRALRQNGQVKYVAFDLTA